ncbi:MAG: PIN domain-containing protein [Armatimonadetes bacterium]|nr:PIN domain-containing protein [Anaerolineae bacterium]
MRIDAIADSSFLYSLYNPTATQHQACLQVAIQYTHIMIPDVTLTEVLYLYQKIHGVRVAAKFLQSFAQQPSLLLSRATRRDLNRAGEVMSSYAQGGTQLDFVDCCIVATAERYTVTRICTLDRRDFSIIRPLHSLHFILLP